MLAAVAAARSTRATPRGAPRGLQMRAFVAFFVLASAFAVRVDDDAQESAPSVTSYWPGPPVGASDCAAALSTQPVCEDAGGGVWTFFKGEFGAEFLLALPAAFSAWERGRLVATFGCGSMRPFYYFSPNQCVAIAQTRVS